MSFLKDNNPDIDWTKGTIRFASSNTPVTATVAQKPVSLNMVNPRQMSKSMHRVLNDVTSSDTKYFVVNLRCLPNDKALLNSLCDSSFDVDMPEIVTDQDADYNSQLQKLLGHHKRILQPLKDLPPKRPEFDHAIDVLPDSEIPAGKVYRMSPLELSELKRQLTEYLDKGWIRVSTSEYAAPILFAKKADGSLRLCVDYRGLNKITKKVQFPLPNIDTLLDSFSGSTVFTAFDLAQGYHQGDRRVTEG